MRNIYIVFIITVFLGVSFFYRDLIIPQGLVFAKQIHNHFSKQLNDSIALNSIDSTNLVVGNVFDGKITDGVTNIWGKENVTFLNEHEIRVSYPKGSINPGGDTRGGAGFIYNLSNPNAVHKILSYEIEFAKNFDFVKGGKLPGLCGGDCPRGGDTSYNGFSLRFMWRSDGALEVYAYLPTENEKNSIYGESLGRGMFNFKPGKKYTISQEVKLSNNRNEIEFIKVYIDDTLVYTQNNINVTQELYLDKFIFSTFFGGSDISWASTRDTSINFGNFVIIDK